MEIKEITRIIECPGCKWQLTVGITSDFNGRIRLYCNRCKQLFLNWTLNKTASGQATLPMANSVPTVSPNSGQEVFATTSPYIPSVGPGRSETSYKISVPENNEGPGGEAEEPEKVGEYKLLKVIGQGAMGVIYLGEHFEKPGKVAIKLLTQELQKDNQAVERFLQEARVHSRLVHPNIVRIYDVGYCGGTGRLYLVMEFVDGESLEKILGNRGAIPERHAIKIAMAVAHALEHALEQHIIHRDLKPANIMIDRRTRKIKVADLGLGKITEEKGATISGQMMGTPYYMPPEQIRNAKEVDHRADIYALGATLYHMLTGRPPYSEYKGTLAIVRAKIYREPIPMTEYVSTLSEGAIKIVEKAMMRNVNERYNTPAQMIQEMEQILGSEQ